VVEVVKGMRVWSDGIGNVPDEVTKAARVALAGEVSLRATYATWLFTGISSPKRQGNTRQERLAKRKTHLWMCKVCLATKFVLARCRNERAKGSMEKHSDGYGERGSV
jgi:hypothetical protein